MDVAPPWKQPARPIPLITTNPTSIRPQRRDLLATINPSKRQSFVNLSSES